MKIGRQNFYIYSAVNPRSGKKISLLAPYVNTDCMNIFLEQMSKDLGTKKAFLVMDCASWHRSKSLKFQENITIIYLPPYSPAVERLWQYIKYNTLRNRVYDTIGLLADVLCNFIVSISSTFVRLVMEFGISAFDVLKPIVGDVFVIGDRRYKVHSPPLRDKSGITWKIKASECLFI